MSRIYSALKVLDEKRASRLGASAGSETTPVRYEPSIAVEVLEPPKEPASVTTEPEGDALSEYRTVSLRVANGPLFPFDGTDPRTAEQYRLVRMNHAAPGSSQDDRRFQRDSRDWKSVTTVNLSAVLALKSESTVIMVDADMRQKKLATSLGIKAEPGLADVLRGTCRLDEAIVRIEEMPNLLVLPSGSTTANPAELLDSPEWKRLTTRLRALFSYVIIDTTPVAAVADFQLVQQASDGVLLVLRPDHTKRSIFQRALQTVAPDKLSAGNRVECRPGLVSL